jgi:hypothetical protein
VTQPKTGKKCRYQPNQLPISPISSACAPYDGYLQSPLLARPAYPPPLMRRPECTWNVVFATQRGNCSSNNSVPFTVTGTRVSSAGGGKVTGGIGPGGNVSVRISVSASVASGSGRLAGNSGAGRWSGIITGDKCSGSWQATRS